MSKRVIEHARSVPEATPICAAALLHLGNRAAVDQALSRLARAGELARICQGVYMRPIETRFGRRSPSVGKALSALAQLWGETIVPSGAASAHALGLTVQVPVRSVYLTSGPNRRLQFGNMEVELRHAPRWQLVVPNSRAGAVIRAMAWLGPEDVRVGLGKVVPGLTAEEVKELSEARARMPQWIAAPLSELVANG